MNTIDITPVVNAVIALAATVVSAGGHQTGIFLYHTPNS